MKILDEVSMANGYLLGINEPDLSKRLTTIHTLYKNWGSNYTFGGRSYLNLASVFPLPRQMFVPNFVEIAQTWLIRSH